MMLHASVIINAPDKMADLNCRKDLGKPNKTGCFKAAGNA